jgi:hypothetical protein
MSTSIVEYNPWIIWRAKQSEPQDLATLQLLQVNDAMIQKGYFVEVPPTLTDVRRSDGGDDQEPLWTSSAISEIDPQDKPVKVADRSSVYSSNIKVAQTPNYITILQTSQQGTKKMERKSESKDKLPLAITFETAEKIQQNYKNDNWENNITNISNIPISNIPPEVVLNFEETLKRERTVETQNPKR